MKPRTWIVWPMESAHKHIIMKLQPMEGQVIPLLFHHHHLLFLSLYRHLQQESVFMHNMEMEGLTKKKQFLFFNTTTSTNKIIIDFAKTHHPQHSLFVLWKQQLPQQQHCLKPFLMEDSAIFLFLMERKKHKEKLYIIYYTWKIFYFICTFFFFQNICSTINWGSECSNTYSRKFTTFMEKNSVSSQIDTISSPTTTTTCLSFTPTSTNIGLNNYYVWTYLNKMPQIKI